MNDEANPTAAPPGYQLHRRITDDKGDRVAFEPPVDCGRISRTLLFHISSRTWVPMKSAKGALTEYGAWATPLPKNRQAQPALTNPAPAAAPTERTT